MIDNTLPETWQGSYGTLNTRRALAEIHARLQALEGNQAQPKSRSAVLIERMVDGQLASKHVVLEYTQLTDFETALTRLRTGYHFVFVAPDVAGRVLDALEADEQQTAGSTQSV